MWKKAPSSVLGMALFASSLGVLVAPTPAEACFDVYLIQLGNPMVYNHKELGLELAGEYAFANTRRPQEDEFGLEPGAFYGITDRLTAHVNASFAGNRLRGVSDEFQSVGGGLYFAILREPFGITPALEGAASIVESGAFDLAASLIFTKAYNNWLFVVHPKLELARAAEETAWNGGYHAGIFYRFGAAATAGWGHEYFVEGNELVTSVFLGATITEGFYLHWELIKGVSTSAADWGTAINLKYLFAL